LCVFTRFQDGRAIELALRRQLSGKPLPDKDRAPSFRRGLPEGKEKHFDSAVDVPLPDCTPVW